MPSFGFKSVSAAKPKVGSRLSATNSRSSSARKSALRKSAKKKRPGPTPGPKKY